MAVQVTRVINTTKLKKIIKQTEIFITLATARGRSQSKVSRDTAPTISGVINPRLTTLTVFTLRSCATIITSAILCVTVT